MELKPLKLRKLDDLAVTVSVKVTWELRFRVWLAVRLIRIAVWTLGGKTKLDLKANVESEDAPAKRPTLH